MKICFLSAFHPATDKRVFDKEAHSLRGAGFEVVHLCGQSAGEPLGRWEKNGIVIETYPRAKGIRGRLRQLIGLYRRARAIGADVYHCNEVDSWAIGAVLRITTGRLCVVDIHEHYPSTFAEKRFPKAVQPIVASIIRLSYAVLAPFTARIVLAKRSVAPDFWFARRKLVLVQNFTPLEALASVPAVPVRAGERGRSPALMIHLGMIGRIRGWPQLLDAMAMSRHSDSVVHIIGEFNDDSEAEFHRRVEALGLKNRIRFDAWMPFAEAFKRLTEADIGLVLFQPGVQNHVYALPHKLFDYMLARIPVIVPECAVEVREIVIGAGCGIPVDTSDPKLIAAAMDRLLDSATERKRMAEAGYEAVLKRYNWEQEAAKLVAMYRALAERTDGRIAGSGKT